MTSAEFARKYNLLKCVSEHGARTYLAEQRGLARGRIVMVHYLDVGNSADARALLDRIGTLTSEAMDKVVETTEVDGVPVAVTLFLPQFESLPAWLGSNVQSSPPVPLPPAKPSDIDQDATLIIPAPEIPKRQPPTRTEPGEFTRIFGGVQSPAPREPASPPPPRPRSSPLPSASPSAPPPPTPPTPPTAPPPRAEPGEFTRIFGKVDSPPKLDAPAEPMLAPVEPLAPLPEPQKQPAPEKRSEGFTDLFQRLSSTPTSSAAIPQAGTTKTPTTPPPAPVPVPPPPVMPSAAFSAPAALPPSPWLTPPARPAEPAGGGGGRAPSEFTRMMARVSPSAPPAAPTAPSGAGASGVAAAGAVAGKAAAAAGVQPPPAARRPIALVIGLIGAFLSAVALVLYFALRA